jgi:uncharacterized protein YbbK (DUF523 family)
VEKILMSACFLGNPVRYDGSALDVSFKVGLDAQAIIDHWLEEGRLVSLCPEVAGGLPTPRPPAEIQFSEIASSKKDRSDLDWRVITSSGVDVSDSFQRGAEIAAQLCRQHGIKLAILTESSPSCGSSTVYDGQFNRTKVLGEGITTALLRQQGIRVFSQFELAEAEDYLKAIEDEDNRRAELKVISQRPLL